MRFEVDETTTRKSAFRAEEMRWLDENESYLEQHYPGMWVAVQGSELVGAGATLLLAAEKAKEHGFEKPFFAPVKRKDYQGLYLIR